MPGMCFPVYMTNRSIYNKETFLRFRERDKSDMAQRLNQFRLELVHKYTHESDRVLDIGIGAGTFMDLHGNCFGFDINTYAVRLLKKLGRFFNPYRDDFDSGNIAAVTFFDSLEHISDPSLILNRLTDQVVVVSIPIFKDKKHLQNSRHFKPREHKWHFTRRQFEAYMRGSGFGIVEERFDETALGREDITTFVLRRIS